MTQALIQRLAQFKHQRSGIVRTVGLHRLGHQALCGIAGHIRRRAADQALDTTVKQSFNQAVGTDEEAIAGLTANRAVLRTEVLILATKHLLQRIAPGMIAGLILGNFTTAQLPTDMRMIVTELSNAARFGQVIDPAIAHMGKIQPAWAHPTQAQGRAHAAQLLITKPHVRELGVNFRKQLMQHILKTDRQPRGLGAKEAWEQSDFGSNTS